MFNAAKSFAQIGSSCSDPYILNLSYGAGNGEFQFHYPDTMMYVKIENVTDKETLTLWLDSNATYQINRIFFKRNNCSGDIILDRSIEMLSYKKVGLLINLSIEDTVILCVKRGSYNNNCNSCDSINNRIYLNFNNVLGGPAPCNQTTFCDNLVLNGSLEYYDPTTVLQFVAPWYNTQYDNIVCNFEAGYYLWDPNNPLSVNNTSPDYFNAIFDGQSGSSFGLPHNSYGIATQNANYLLNGCGSLLPEQNNPYFPVDPTNTFSYNNAFGGEGFGIATELLRADLNPLQPLSLGHLYYIQCSFASRWFSNYSGNIEIDLHANQNYVESYYVPTQTAPPPVSMSIETFAPNSSLDWSVFNTIYTAQGNETSLWIGNLRKLPPNAIPNPVSNVSCISNSDYYYFDNIVVKEFFADAGPTTITACEEEGVVIGGSSCPFPNATYSWTPAQYFVNPTSPNPTFVAPLGSAPSTIQVTLTVSIEVNNGFIYDPNNPITAPVTHTTSSTVDISVIAGTPITLGGTTTVMPNDIAYLNATGGSNYVWTGSDGTSYTGASITTGPLTQDVTYTVNALSNSGCSVTETITVTVTPLPAECINDPNYPNTIIIPNGTTDATFLAMNLGVTVNNVYVVTSKNFALEGTLNFSSAMNVKFENCHFFCYDASEIINYGMLDLHRSRFEACHYMWKGIQNNFGIRVESCNFKDAEFAIHLKNLSRYRISSTTFENNLYGIFMGETNLLSVITGYDFNNQFTNPLPLKDEYANMANWQAKSESGIRIESLKYPIQIGLEAANAAPLSITNKFYNINNGIYIVNSDINVVNSMFFSIIPLIQRTVPAFLKYDGCAIYAQSTFMPKKLMVTPIPNYTGHEFANCTEGIKTNRVSLNAVRLSMNNIGSGVQCFNSLMCIHYVCENTITSQFRGIEISGAGFANSVNVNSNVITVSNLIASSGISVTATQLGIANNVNIKFNVITAGRTTMNGILTSKLSSPTLLCNTVKRVNNSSQYSQLIALNGYNISGCNGANLTTNSMEWLSAGSTANNGNDYVITSSTGSELVCNNSAVSNVGFKISSNCMDLIFRRNKIGSHAIGLYYDGTANSGSQPANPSAETEGNKWLGSYSSLGAKNEALPPDVNNSIFYYHPSNTNINKPANNSWFPPNWFNANGSSFIQPDCTTGACILNQIANPGNNDYYRAIANGSITTVGYPEQTKWMAQSYLINRLGKDTTLRNSDDSLHYFYYAPESRTLRAIKEIDARNNNYATTSMLISHSVFANDGLLNVISQNMTQQLNDTLMPDSVFYSLSADLQEQYAFINDVNEGFLNDVFELLDENLNQAKEINDTLQSTNANETILQTINNIYYRYHRSNYAKINEDDASMIAYIAHLCPLAAGPAVYQARDLYTLLVDSVVYHDSVKCAMQGYVREELQVFEPKGAIQKIAPAYFKAFPVPSKQAVELQFTELNSEANLTVFNIQGQLIYQATIQKGLSKFNLDIEEYSEGVYQFLLVNNEFSKRSKICKIK